LSGQDEVDVGFALMDMNVSQKAEKSAYVVLMGMLFYTL